MKRQEIFYFLNYLTKLAHLVHINIGDRKGLHPSYVDKALSWSLLVVILFLLFVILFMFSNRNMFEWWCAEAFLQSWSCLLKDPARSHLLDISALISNQHLRRCYIKCPFLGLGAYFGQFSSNGISFHHELMFAMGLEF